MTTLETQRMAYLKGFNEAAQGKWISVKDKLPKEDEIVLLFIPAYPGITIGKLWNGTFDDMVERFNHDNPITHWMPLPPPPAVD